MPRPSDEQLYGSAHDTPGYGPDQASNFTTSVVAPLDVQAAPTQAMALAKALGHAVDVATPELAQQARQQGAADEASGEAAAALGNVDPNNTAQGYAVGVTKIQTQTTAVQAANAAKQFYAANPTMPMNDSTDENGNKVPGLISSIDNIFRQHFPDGQETNPEQAKVMAPILTNTISEIAGAKNVATIRQNQQQAEDTASALLMHDAQNPGSQAFNVQDQLATLTQVYGGDRSAARDSLVHAIGEAAVHTGQPDIINHLLPTDVDFGGGAGLTPANQSYIDTATQRATAKQQQNQGNAAGQSEMNIVQQVSKGKDPTAMLDQYATLPGASPSFYRQMTDWYRSSSTKADDKAPPAASFDLQSAVYTGQVTSAAQAQQWVSAKGYKGQAAVDLMGHAVSALSETQKTNADDPNYKATSEYLSSQYTNLDPLTRDWTSVQAKQQHANVMQTFVQSYNQAVSQNKSPADAAASASAQAQQQWGAPMSEQKSVQKVPQTPQDQAAFLRNRGNLTPSALSAAGLNGSTIKQLRDRNLISSDEASAAASALLNH
jgi:flagellar biosynthesis chaperone FliJ